MLLKAESWVPTAAAVAAGFVLARVFGAVARRWRLSPGARSLSAVGTQQESVPVTAAVDSAAAVASATPASDSAAVVASRRSGDDAATADSGVEAKRSRLRALLSQEDYKMVLLVRMDLSMGKGKIAAQCGHATLGTYKVARQQKPDWVEAWEYVGQKKIALKVDSEAAMIAFAGKARDAGLPHYLVIDAGHTQVDPGSRTVLGIGPAPSSRIDAITGKLKLL